MRQISRKKRLSPSGRVREEREAQVRDVACALRSLIPGSSAELKAAAKKRIDVLTAQVRREQRAKVSK